MDFRSVYATTPTLCDDDATTNRYTGEVKDTRPCSLRGGPVDGLTLSLYL